VFEIKLPSLTMLAAIAAIAALTACGGGGGGAALPAAGLLPNPSSGGSSGTARTTPAPTAPPVPAATATPAAAGTPLPGLPIITDTNPSTAGVFVGAACGGQAKISCSQFASTFRHQLAIAEVYVDWGSDLTTFIQHEGMSAWSAQGTTPEITWMPYSMNGQVVTYDAINSGAYDSFIKTSAAELRLYGQTVLLRPFHEFNGNWYPWGLVNQGASSATDAAFIQAWQRIHNIFTQEGATNVKFVWCFSSSGIPNAATNPWNNPAAAYPGDAYVDWIGFDAYNRGSMTDGQPWTSFDATIGSAYNLAVSISSTKPIMLSEMASNEYGDGGAMKSQWITQMLSELSRPQSMNPYPNLRAFVWFEADNASYLYDSESTQPTYNAFVSGLRATQANGLPAFRGNGNALDQITTP
jgi:beta-mannanase